MNEYYKSKYLEKNIEGAWTEYDPEQQKIIKWLRLTTELLQDGLSDRYDDLIPSEGDVYKNSIQFLTFVDLISEGPIEGFVDELGRTTSNPLEAIYFDDTVIKPTVRNDSDPDVYSKANILNAESALPQANPSEVPPIINYYNTDN